MARRAEVAKIGASLSSVWAGLVLGVGDDRRNLVAVGNPGDVGSEQTYDQGNGRVTSEVIEAEPKHYVRYRLRFSQWWTRLFLMKGQVEADYEVKGSRRGHATYIRAVADYDAPMWPTAMMLVAALFSLIAMNQADGSGFLPWTFPVALFLFGGILMQYLPRVVAHKLVTGATLRRLTRLAEHGDFHGEVQWTRRVVDEANAPPVQQEPPRPVSHTVESHLTGPVAKVQPS